MERAVGFYQVRRAKRHARKINRDSVQRRVPGKRHHLGNKKIGRSGWEFFLDNGKRELSTELRRKNGGRGVTDVQKGGKRL